MSAPLEQLAEGLAALLPDAAARLVGEGVEVGAAEPTPQRGDASAFAELEGSVVTVFAEYLDSSEGGNVVVFDLASARSVVGSTEEGPLGDAEIADLRAAGVVLLEAAGRAVSSALGARIAFAGPVVRVHESAAEATATLPFCTHQAAAILRVGDQPVHVVALIPETVAVRLSDELDGMTSTDVEARPAWHGTQAAQPSLAGVRVRVSAELGRAAVPSQELVQLPSGAVVELDRRVDEPIEILVNGQPYAYGRLVVADSGEWAVEIDRVRGLA